MYVCTYICEFSLISHQCGTQIKMKKGTFMYVWNTFDTYVCMYVNTEYKYVTIHTFYIIKTFCMYVPT